MLELESALRHVMGFAPLLYTGDVVLDLHGCDKINKPFTEEEENAAHLASTMRNSCA